MNNSSSANGDRNETRCYVDPEASCLEAAATQRACRRKRPTPGYTLLEIMMTVLIIGLLTSIAIPSFRTVRNQARDKEAEVYLQMVCAAVEQLAWDCGIWPNGLARNIFSSAEVWDLSVASAGIISTNNTYDGWKGPYMTAIMKDPWGMNYFFDPDYVYGGTWNGSSRSGGTNYVVVGSFGRDRIGKNRYDDNDLIVTISPSPAQLSVGP